MEDGETTSEMEAKGPFSKGEEGVVDLGYTQV